MAKKKKAPSRAVTMAEQSPPVRSYTPPPKQYQAQLAPWSSDDRYPTILGSRLSLTYLSSVYRSAQTGYRREYVDALDELVERDAHAYACLSQRFWTVAGARLSMHPAKCDASEEELAKEISDDCERAIHGIEQRRQALSAILWGNFYGVSASEIGWEVTNGKWTPARLYWIHSRRLMYPDPFSWGVRIWDWGLVSGWTSFDRNPTNRTMGLGPADYPGKFIVHEPQLRGDYPTRDGIGREIAYWMTLKLMAARGMSQFVERFGKPWPVGYYSTSKDGDNNPRSATDDDIEALKVALNGLGGGSTGGNAALPNSVKINLDGPTSGSIPAELPQAALIKVCNAEISKAVLGNSDTIESGPNGSRSATEIRNQSTLEIYRYDAACLCDTLKRDLIWWYVHLNYPGMEHLCPTPHLDVEPPPDRAAEAKIILTMVQAGAPIDADKAARATGVDLIPNETEGPRRLGFCAPAPPSTFDPKIEPPAPSPVPGNSDEEPVPNTEPDAKPDKKQLAAKSKNTKEK